MQQGVQKDATCNIQQCCVRLPGALHILGPFTECNDRFPYHFVNLNLVKSCPFITWSLKKVPLLGKVFPWENPLPPTPHTLVNTKANHEQKLGATGQQPWAQPLILTRIMCSFHITTYYYFIHPPSSLSAMLLLPIFSKTSARWPTVALLPSCSFHKIRRAFALSRLLLYSSSRL